MKKKQRRNIIFVVIIGLVLIVILLFSGFKFPFSTTPIDTGKSPSPFQCPSGEGINCIVKGVMECNDPQNNAKVIFRTNGNWIAWDVDNNGALECFSIKSNPSPTCNLQINNKILLPLNIPIYGGKIFYGNPITIFTKKTEVDYNYCADTRLLAGTGCELSIIPKAPYTANNQEITSGSQSLYSCSGNFYIERNGQKIYPEALSYSSSTTAGQDTSSQYSILPGDKAYVTGGSNSYIEYTTNRVYDTCTSDECISNPMGFKNCTWDSNLKLYIKSPIINLCNPGYECKVVSNTARCLLIPQCSVSFCNDLKTGYYDCTNGVKGTTLHSCDTLNGFTCKDSISGAKCEPPFITHELTTSKLGYTNTENIIVNVHILSQDPLINSGSVKVYLWDSVDAVVPIATYPIDNFNFKSDSTVPITISGLGINKYYLTMEAFYNSRSVKFDNKPYFRVNLPVSCTLSISGENRPTPYVGNNVKVEVFTEAVLDTNPTLKILYNNNLISYNNPIAGASGDKYIYTYLFNFDNPGLLEASANVVRGGITSESCSMSKNVNKISLDVNFIDLVDCVKFGTARTFNFETKILDEYIDVNNTLTIAKALDTSSGHSVGVTRIGKGKYQFVFDEKTKGGFTINLKAYSSDFNVIGENPTLPQIEVRDDCQNSECVNVQDCVNKGTNYICSSGKCVSNDGNKYMMYFIVGGIVILGIIIIIMVWFFLKKKKSGVELGL